MSLGERDPHDAAAAGISYDYRDQETKDKEARAKAGRDYRASKRGGLPAVASPEEVNKAWIEGSRRSMGRSWLSRPKDKTWSWTLGDTLGLIGLAAAPFTFGGSLAAGIGGQAVNLASGTTRRRLRSILGTQDPRERARNLSPASEALPRRAGDPEINKAWARAKAGQPSLSSGLSPPGGRDLGSFSEDAALAKRKLLLKLKLGK